MSRWEGKIGAQHGSMAAKIIITTHINLTQHSHVLNLYYHPVVTIIVYYSCFTHGETEALRGEVHTPSKW